jgi:hypothetical protein
MQRALNFHIAATECQQVVPNLPLEALKGDFGFKLKAGAVARPKLCEKHSIRFAQPCCFIRDVIIYDVLRIAFAIYWHILAQRGTKRFLLVRVFPKK